MGKLFSDAAATPPFSPADSTSSSATFAEIFAHQITQSDKRCLSETPDKSKPGESQFLVMAPLEHEKPDHEKTAHEKTNQKSELQEKGENALGRQVMEHLKDHDWLVDHQKEVRWALERAWDKMGLSDFKSFMREIEKKSDGNLYLESGNGLLGSINPLNPPGNQVARVYLWHCLVRPDTLIFDTRRQMHWAP